MAKVNNYSSWLFLGAALFAGAGAFWLSHVYLKNQEEKLRTEVAGGKQTMVQVVVAAGNLPAGSVVGPQTMSTGKLPKAFVSQRFVSAQNFAAVQGHTLVRSKAAGEPLLMDDVGGVFVERFSDLLKPGERAVTLEATEINSNSGLLLPGDRGDLYVIAKDAGGGGDEAQSLVPLLENVHVLAAGVESLRAQEQKYQPLKERGERYDSITVAVSVEDAEKLVLARKAGDIAYLLRNSQDQARDVTSRMSSSQLGVGGGLVGPRSLNGGGDSYEYFSVTEPAGVLKPLAVTATPSTSGGGSSGGMAAAGASGGDNLQAAAAAAAKALGNQTSPAPTMDAKALEKQLAGAGAAVAGAPAAPAATTNKSSRE